MSILKTSIHWTTQAGDDREAYVRVTYTGYGADAGDFYQPPEPAFVEISSIALIEGDHDIPDWFYDDSDLQAECLADWIADGIEAAEWAEQSRRDSMMGGF